MANFVARVINIDPEEEIVNGANDHLQNPELLNGLTDGTTPDCNRTGEAVEVGDSLRTCFRRKVVRLIFVLSPGYATLP